MHVLRMLRFGGMTGRFYAPATDAGIGGDAQMTSEGADAFDAGDPSGDAPAVGDHTDEPADAEDDDSLLLGSDDDAQHDRRPLEEQLKALRKANSRLKRNALKHRSTLDRVRGLDLDTVVAHARSFSELQRAAQSNPKLRSLLTGAGDVEDREPTRASAKPAALPSLPTEFTAQTLGFDPDESTANRVLANAIQTLAALGPRLAALEALAPKVQSIDRTLTSRQAAEERSTWNQQVHTFEAELKKVAPGNELLLALARDAMHGAYQTRASHGQTAQQIVQHYLTKFVKAGQLTARQAGQVSAATQARIATHNRSLPSPPAGGGRPSSPQGNQKRLLKDVHKQLRAGSIGPR